MSFALRFLLPLSLLFVLAFPATLFAATDAPMFAGNTLTIHGETFTWTGPATEDASWHYDTYTNATSQSVTVTGMVGFADLATVSGAGSGGTVAGHLSSGVYADNAQTSTTQGSWQISGVSYTSRSIQATYWVNFMYGFLNENGVEDYTGADGTYHRAWQTSVDYTETQETFSGGHVPFSGHASLQVFGSTYAFDVASSFSNNWYDASEGGWTDRYTSADGGILTISRNISSNSPTAQVMVMVWDPHAGTVSSYSSTSVPDNTLSSVIWRARSSPSFAKNQLWMDGKLLNWQSGSIATNGLITDLYSGAGGNLSITAQAVDYFKNNAAATVTITSAGGGTGTLGHDGVFAMSGYSLQNASPNHSAPLFTGNNRVIRVMGSDFSFSGGYQDSLGNRADVYVSPSLGRLSLFGNTSSPNTATITLLYYSSLKSGTFSNGVFSIPNMGEIGYPGNQPNVYGPPAFWVRGVFYTRTSDTALTYEDTAGHTITLGGSASYPTLAGEDASGTFSGAFARDPVGVFLVQDAQGAASVPVLPANADGTLHLSWEAPPAGMPPATMVVDGRIWVFLGTAVEDTNAATSAAYYGNATASDEGDWLLKLRTDGSGVATCTDYGTAASTVGSYSSQTHLFQTSGPQSGFPVPVYGVDPNANDALWGLTQPQDGLPATFIVRGEAWRLAAFDEPTDTFTYQGFYSGQWMTLGAADASGQRLVTLADPVHNNGSTATTQGTLSSERRSVRLRDGTLALSGNEQGAQVAVQHEDDYQLHTIAADLDLVGNNLSFGVLQGDASLAGALFQFADDSATASLHSILSRPQAQWGWWKAEGTDADALRPVMWLGSDHRLNLYKAGAYAAPAIVLDPAGTSSFQGPVRVPQSGDIPMGIYQEGDPP